MANKKRILLSLLVLILVFAFSIFILSLDGQLNVVTVVLFGFIFTMCWVVDIRRLAHAQKENKIRYKSMSKIATYAPSTISIYDSTYALLLREVSLVAVSEGCELLAVGLDAIKQLASQDAEAHVIGSPLKNDVIADFDSATAMIKHLIKVAHPKPFFRRPSIAVCSPLGLTAVEMKAFRDAMMMAGSRATTVLELTSASSLENPEKYTLIIEIMHQQECHLFHNLEHKRSRQGNRILD